MAEILRQADPAERVESGAIIPPDATSKARTPPIGPVAHVPGADPSREYVSGEPRLFVSRFVKSLPQYIDDVTRDFGSDLYDRMLNDAQVYSCVNILKVATLSDGYRVQPAIKDENHPDYEKAKFWADFCEYCVEHCERPFESFLYEMLDALAFGHKVAEQILEPTGYKNYAHWWTLKNLKVKPRGTYSFVTDAWTNIVGILGLVPGMGAPVLVGHIVADPSHLSNLLPIEKFVVFTFNPRDNDPRGRSILRPIYNPWWIKMQTWGEYLKFLAQFASPSLWATTPEGAVERIVNGVSVTPEETLNARLQDIRGGSTGAFPFGTMINAIPVNERGDAFNLAFTLFDKQIAKGTLGQTLATEEAEHMARAASSNHQDILDIGVRYVRKQLGAAIKHNLFRNLIRWNAGEETAKKFTPHLTFGSEAMHGDWTAEASIINGLLQNPALDERQKNILLERIGLPPRKSVVIPQVPQELVEKLQQAIGDTQVPQPQQYDQRDDATRPTPPPAQGEPMDARMSAGAAFDFEDSISDNELTAVARVLKKACGKRTASRRRK